MFGSDSDDYLKRIASVQFLKVILIFVFLMFSLRACERIANKQIDSVKIEAAQKQ